jgi:hypothetical protein
MSNTERVSGELVGREKSFAVKLNLTVSEAPATGPNRAPERTIEDIEPATLAGIPDGDYTLRFWFDGKQEEHPVRISFGYLLAR